MKITNVPIGFSIVFEEISLRCICFDLLFWRKGIKKEKMYIKKRTNIVFFKNGRADRSILNVKVGMHMLSDHDFFLSARIPYPTLKVQHTQK